jgi:hypothetical protein
MSNNRRNAVYQVTLTALELDRLRVIGGGNLSRGVILATRAWYGGAPLAQTTKTQHKITIDATTATLLEREGAGWVSNGIHKILATKEI